MWRLVEAILSGTRRRVKDYVYLPLAIRSMRSNNSRFSEYKPHLFSMALMGLWHGAAWTYVAWGFYHGFLLVLVDALGSIKSLKAFGRRIPKAFWIFLFFHLTALSLLIFRANSISQIGSLTSR